MLLTCCSPGSLIYSPVTPTAVAHNICWGMEWDRIPVTRSDIVIVFCWVDRPLDLPSLFCYAVLCYWFVVFPLETFPSLLSGEWMELRFDSLHCQRDQKKIVEQIRGWQRDYRKGIIYAGWICSVGDLIMIEMVECDFMYNIENFISSSVSLTGFSSVQSQSFRYCRLILVPIWTRLSLSPRPNSDQYVANCDHCF